MVDKLYKQRKNWSIACEIVTGIIKKNKADMKDRVDSGVLFFTGWSGKTSKEGNIWTEISKLTD